MANTRIQSPFKITTADNNNVLVLGSPAYASVGTIALSVVNSGSFSGTIIVKARPSGLEVASTVGFLAHPYVGANVNGTPGDSSWVTTTLTTNSTLFIPATGLEIGLLVTCASGSADLYFRHVEGAAA